ncbi:MAG: Lsr2 family protein [Gordonia sp.]|nr:Lsr2 family protein [Gordonia sp. (in: high G+C Gram-positive bacteria)]
MATVTRFEFTDDIDGKALDVEDLTIVTWSWLGVDYEFETSAANLDRIENGRVPVSTLLAKSRRVGGRKRAPTRARAKTAPVANSGATADTTTIRAWAQQNGYEVADRGRIPATIIDAYTTEH